jgi:dihydroneopterin aldolase
MSIQKIIQEAVSKNPVGLKESLEEELAKRVAEAIEAKLEESVELTEE